MKNIILNMVINQIMIFDGFVKVTNYNFSCYDKLLNSMRKFVENTSFDRINNWVPSGASWFDHYGHRAHDVDIEKV